MTLIGVVKFPFYLIIGTILLLFSPSFRAIVRAKLRGANDPVKAGENVIAVLITGNDKKFIGG